MTTITIPLEDNKLKMLKEKSEKLGVNYQDIIKASIDDLLTNPDESFLATLNYLLNKNKELYERLS